MDKDTRRGLIIAVIGSLFIWSVLFLATVGAIRLLGGS